MSNTPARSSGRSSFRSQCLNFTFEGSVSAGGTPSNEMSKPSNRAEEATESRASRSQILVARLLVRRQSRSM